VGLFAKAALFPLHAWLPPAHSSAPTAASALLSALVVMASVYCLLRLWVGVFAPVVEPRLAQLVGALGAAGVIWGSLLALRQQRLKLLVAYSTVAQLGYVLILLPLLAGAGAAAAWTGGIWLLLSHAFAKASMFLAAGLILHARGRDQVSDMVGAARQLPVAVFAVGIAGLTLMGLPPSGGFVAKWLLLEASIRSGQWWWVPVLILGGFLAAGYVFRMLSPAFKDAAGLERFEPVPRLPQFICLALALISVGMGLYAAPLLEALEAMLRVGGTTA
jgi:multicomponent Na+:H+ antiporter subunit D